ncbi:MAG: RIP metalloprotease RseP [Pseudomonadota bacterium]
MTTVLIMIIVLGALIFVHELGHFLLAKMFRVRVERFSLGFGPKIWSQTVGETEYRLAAVPLGGYVKLYGENPGEEVEEAEKKRSFMHRSLWQRALIVGAGPISNLIFAFFVFFITLALFGRPTLPPVIKDVQKGLPAQKAGLKSGDRILKIDGRRVDEWEGLAAIISENEERPLVISFVRQGRAMETRVTPMLITRKTIFGEEVKLPAIGIMPPDEPVMERIDPLEAFVGGARQTWRTVHLTYTSIVKLIQRIVPISTLGGPILIFKLTGQQAEAGIVPLLFFVAVLSINLAVMNLLPIPVLDGGHLFFMGVELILGRPVSLKKREIAQQIGLVILISLMAVVFYNDILREIR